MHRCVTEEEEVQSYLIRRCSVGTRPLRESLVQFEILAALVEKNSQTDADQDSRGQRSTVKFTEDMNASQKLIRTQEDH